MSEKKTLPVGLDWTALVLVWRPCKTFGFGGLFSNIYQFIKSKKSGLQVYKMKIKVLK